MSDLPLLEVHGIAASIGQYRILHDVGFTVVRGSATAILGRNGAGKTSSLRTVLGFLIPRSGEVIFRGEPITGRAPDDIARRGIGYVPERRGVFGGLTVAENLRLAHGNRCGPDLALELFPELTSRLQEKAGRLSGGQQQMLAIGRALLQSPSLLILDEPTQGLAPLIVDQLVTALRTLTPETTLLVVEQNIEAAMALTDQYVIVDDGRTVAHGATATLDTASIERYLALGEYVEGGA
jgi:branched-chain amino acid transport system ATP-binding protein